MGIREEREVQAAQFVSMCDLLEGLADTEATTIKEVAGYLLDKLKRDGAPRFLRRDAQALSHFKADSKQLDKLLRHVAYSGNCDGDSSWDFEPGRQEFIDYGWFRDEMADFLKRVEIVPPACCSSLWKPEPKRPHWHKAYENRQRISLGDAVCLLDGIDPEEEQPFGINDCQGHADLRRWRAALIDAMVSGRWDFDPSTWGADQNEQTFLHSGIKAWARDTGATWPFLNDAKAPNPESPEGRAMARALKAAKARIAELEQEIQAKRQADSDTPQPTKLMRLAVEVQRRYWGTNWNPADPDTKTTQETIVAWLRETHPELSDAEVRAAEKVACPFDRNPARRA